MHSSLTMWLSVALGGAFGASARYGVAAVMLRLMGPNFPWGTLTVNVVGSLLMGLLVEALALRFNVSPEVRVMLVTGFLGGFTTFSAFSLDTANLIERNAFAPAAIYVAVSVLLSVGALFAGLALGRAVWA
jgi:CrcB protein